MLFNKIVVKIIIFYLAIIITHCYHVNLKMELVSSKNPCLLKKQLMNMCLMNPNGNTNSGRINNDKSQSDCNRTRTHNHLVGKGTLKS